MINHDQSWSLPRGNTPVPSRWQATFEHLGSGAALRFASCRRRCRVSSALQPRLQGTLANNILARSASTAPAWSAVG